MITKHWVTREPTTDNNCQTLRNSGARIRQYYGEFWVTTMIDTDTDEQEQLVKLIMPKAYLLSTDYNI